MTKRYEYDVYNLGWNIDKLNQHCAKDGWRVIEYLGRDEEGDWNLLLEREVPDGSHVEA